jgi:hypothetical protein
MQEIDRLFFDKYSIDPGGELFVSDQFTDWGAAYVDYDGFELTGVDEEEWPEVN